MKKIVFLCLAVVTFNLFGCSDKATEPEPPTEGYIVPLHVGNQWKYEVTDYENNTVDTIDIVIQSEQIVNGVKTYRISRSFRHEDTTFLYNSSEYFWSHFFLLGSKFYMPKYPCKTGDMWVIDTIYRDGIAKEQIRLTVISTNAQRIINGKNYTCYHYKEAWHEALNGKILSVFTTDCYYVPNIGLVEQVYLVYHARPLIRIVLLSYSLK